MVAQSSPLHILTLSGFDRGAGWSSAGGTGLGRGGWATTLWKPPGMEMEKSAPFVAIMTDDCCLANSDRRMRAAVELMHMVC